MHCALTEARGARAARTLQIVQNTLLEMFNDRETAPEPPAACRTLPALIQTQALRRPDEVFIQTWSVSNGVVESLTFGAFRERVACAMCALQTYAGVRAGTGERIVFLAKNSSEQLTFCAAVACLGAVSVQLNWRQPADVLARLCEDVEARRMIASGTLVGVATDIVAASTQFAEKIVLVLDAGATAGVSSASLVGSQASIVLQAEIAEEVPEGGDENVPLIHRETTRQSGSSTTRVLQQPLTSRQGEEWERCNALWYQQLAALRADSGAVMFFTTGSTAKPKAVLHTHATILAVVKSKHLANDALHTFDGNSVASEGYTAASLSFLPTYHVIGGSPALPPTRRRLIIPRLIVTSLTRPLTMMDARYTQQASISICSTISMQGCAAS